MFNKTGIESYFNAEKAESGLFVFIGLAAIITALVFLIFIKERFYTGASFPFLLVGLLLAVVGYTVYQRSDADRMRNVYAYDINPHELKEKEIPRMKTVMHNFVIYRYSDLFLLLAGIALYIYFFRDFYNDFWSGFGLALAVMSLIALTADFFAEQRGKKYLDGLEEYCKGK